MEIKGTGAARRLKKFTGKFAALTLALTLIGGGNEVRAQTLVSAQRPLVIQNDRGGVLTQRLREIRALRQSRRPIEIRGGVCFSTCTMYLGLPNTCISPNTTFGFHGPSSYGRALDPEMFNRASRVISRFYPAPLKSWYMNEARYQINTIAKVKGANIIRMGVRAC